MYVVLDTSVIIAAFLRPTGFVSALIGRLETSENWLACTSRSILTEFEEKLSNRGVNQTQINIFLDSFLKYAVICDEISYTIDQVQSDDHIIGCLRQCRANLVVTNDRSLIRRLKKLCVAAIRPSEFQAYFSQ